MDIAVNLDLATAKALTDLHQYINSDLVFSNLKLQPLYSEIATVEVAISYKLWSSDYQTCVLRPPCRYIKLKST